jgi:ABC-type sugar transport system substrate-binding protein
MSKTSTRAYAAIGIAAASLFAAACGGGGTSGGATTGSSDSAGLARAKAVVEKASERPSSLTVTQPIGKPVPTGKQIVFVSCGVEACAVQGPILQEAASLLGWSVKQVATDGTPEKVQGAIDAAIRGGADAVIINAADRDALSKQIAEAQKAGVEMVTCCSIAQAGGGLLFNTATDKQNGSIGDYLAADVVADSNGKANALYVNISAFSILKAVGSTFESKMKEYCPGCGVASIDIPATSLGKDAPDRIVSYLRSHPDTNYVALSVSDALGAGLPAALKAAGLADKVKIVGQGGGSQTYQDLRNGAIDALVPGDRYSYDYQMIDALARHWAGVPLVQAGPPYWLMKPDTVPADTAKDFPLVPDYKEQWMKLWGKA